MLEQTNFSTYKKVILKKDFNKSNFDLLFDFFKMKKQHKTNVFFNETLINALSMLNDEEMKTIIDINNTVAFIFEDSYHKYEDIIIDFLEETSLCPVLPAEYGDYNEKFTKYAIKNNKENILHLLIEIEPLIFFNNEELLNINYLKFFINLFTKKYSNFILNDKQKYKIEKIIFNHYNMSYISYNEFIQKHLPQINEKDYPEIKDFDKIISILEIKKEKQYLQENNTTCKINKSKKL